MGCGACALGLGSDKRGNTPPTPYRFFEMRREEKQSYALALTLKKAYNNLQQL